MKVANDILVERPGWLAAMEMRVSFPGNSCQLWRISVGRGVVKSVPAMYATTQLDTGKAKNINVYGGLSFQDEALGLCVRRVKL
jgi:hypothetical protein